MCIEVGEGGGIGVEVSVCAQTFNVRGTGDSLFMKPPSGRAVRSGRKERNLRLGVVC